MMTGKNDHWETVNQNYLMAAIATVREELEWYAGSAAKKQGRGVDFTRPAATNLGKELARIDAELHAPAAIEALTSVFGLSSFERKIILMCAGVELDSSFAALVASLQGDPSCVLPTFSTALAAFPDAHWSALSPGSPLRYWQLTEVNSRQLLTMSQLKIDERILHFLTGVNQVDGRISGVINSCREEADLVAPHRKQADQILKAINQCRADGTIPVVQLSGQEILDLSPLAAGVSAGLGMDLWIMSSNSLPLNQKELNDLVRIWNRESYLGTGALLLECTDAEADNPARLQMIRDFCENVRGVCFTTHRLWKPVLRRPVIHLEVQKPSANEQQVLWHNLLGQNSARLNGDLDRVAGQFNLGASTIRAICSELNNHFFAGEAEASPDHLMPGDHVWSACCAHTRPALEDLAHRIDPVARWEDLVLPEQQRNTLREISRQVRYRVKVYNDWGFGRKGLRGLGISALFSGESGTGKTMAAEVLANELKLDLYRIDLSQVVNKYIGETEKNLRKIFDAAENGGSILLFDEADALFGKRSEVKDSHDRYANIEVSYLLQRMEAYQGLAILTTNMKNSLDKAFMRRIRFVVQFPFPDFKQRAEIWQKIFPVETPKEPLDFGKLARMNIAGGTIRNIALNAAFMAASEGLPVGMGHISVAARGEYAKLEKQMSTGEMIM